MKIDENTSRVFEILKFGSICLVFFGHFIGDIIPLIYIPVTTALIVFSFSSGYFTNLKYKNSFNLQIFWKKKVQRLGTKLMVINCFLLSVFVFQNKSGVWTWQTIVHFLGLTGILNWLHISNPSPFGRGLWFFTLLIIFYLVYPGIKKNSITTLAHIHNIFHVVLAYLCSRVHNPGHALYLTAAGFIAGAYWGKGNNVTISPFLSLCVCGFCFVGLLGFNLVISIQ